jgi:RNAse (barnase) inhibitor barstar
VADEVEFVWLQNELPWVSGGFIHRLPRNIEAGVTDLEALGFEVVRLDGTGINDRESFHREVAEVFRFPDYYGRNWDAFDECFGELEMAPHLAVVWTDADQLATHDLKTFAEAVCMFNDHARERSKLGTQLQLFLGVPDQLHNDE